MPQHMSRYSFFLFAINLVFSVTAMAAETEYNLGEIVISGEQPRIVETIGTLDIVTADDIHRSGARNLFEAIELLPGISVRSGGDGVPRIDIRGLRTRHVTLLLDGVPINSAIDGQFDPAAIDVANISRIKVTRGTSSVLYGSGGNAGVINIITKTGGAKPAGHALVEIGNGGTQHAQGSFGGSGENWRGFASASGYHRNYFELSNDYDIVPVTGAPTPNNFQPQDERINSDRTDSNFYGNFLWQPLSRTEVGVSSSYRKGYYGKPFDVRDFTGADADPFARRPRFERLDDFEGFSLNMTGQHEFLFPLNIRPMLFFNRLDELTNNYDNANFNTQIINRAFRQNTRSDIFGGGLQASYEFADFGLGSAAFNCRREQWHATGFQVGGGNAVSPVQIDETSDICSIAYEHEIQVFDRLGLTGGIGSVWQDRPAQGNDSDDTTYLLGANFRLFQQTRLHISHSRQVRFPTLRDLFEPGRGNPALESETTDQYEAGIEHDFTMMPVSLDITVFRTDAEDFIESGPSGLAENIQELSFEGMEITAEINPVPNLNLHIGYTYLEAENLSDGVINRDLQNRPEHIFTVEAGYGLPGDFDIYASLLHVVNNLELSRVAPIETRETGDYDVVDIKLEKTFPGGFSVFGRANNLLDQSYVESGGLPAPGRTIFLGGEVALGF